MHPILLPLALLFMWYLNQEVQVKMQDQTRFVENTGGEAYFWVLGADEPVQGEALAKNTEAMEALEANNPLSAKTLLKESLKISSPPPSPMNNLGVAEIFLGNYTQGIAYIRESYRMSNYQLHAAAANNALINYMEGNMALAIEASTFVLDRNPDFTSALSAQITMALAYLAMGDCASAKDLEEGLRGMAFDEDDAFTNGKVGFILHKIQACN